MADTLRLAIVADIHHGEDHYTKKGSAALPLMGEFARFVRDARPDAVIDLVGGVLEGIAKRRAERQAAEAANPQQPSSAAPPRRGRLLRRLAPPPAAPAENP